VSDYNNQRKARSRELAVGVYRDVTRRFKLPNDRQVWALCAEQNPEWSLCEIEHYARMMFCDRKQYVGVDRNVEIIARNQARYPGVRFIAEEWVNALAYAVDFKPGYVHLDTTAFADHSHTARLIVDTMLLLPPDVFLVFNVIAEDTYTHKQRSTDVLLKRIAQQLEKSKLEKWVPCGDFPYRGSRRSTWMHTFMLYRGRG
jgi:hypothetical protein